MSDVSAIGQYSVKARIGSQSSIHCIHGVLALRDRFSQPRLEMRVRAAALVNGCDQPRIFQHQLSELGMEPSRLTLMQAMQFLCVAIRLVGAGLSFCEEMIKATAIFLDRFTSRGVHAFQLCSDPRAQADPFGVDLRQLLVRKGAKEVQGIVQLDLDEWREVRVDGRAPRESCEPSFNENGSERITKAVLVARHLTASLRFTDPRVLGEDTANRLD